MKLFVLSAAMLGATAMAGAAQPLYQSPEPPETGLWVPTIVSVPQGESRDAAFSVIVRNVDPALAANLTVSVSPNPSRRDAGVLSLAGDTCTGATLARHGDCRLRFEARAACGKPGSTTWFVTVNPASGAPVTTQVLVANKTGKCE